MTIAILIIAHLVYVLKLAANIDSESTRGFLTGVLLTLLCWQVNPVWGIVTLCYTLLTYLIISVVKQINK